MEYRDFRFEIIVRQEDKRYIPFRYSGRAFFMIYKEKEVLWKTWESSQSPFSIGKTEEEAFKKATEYTKEWIDEYHSQNRKIT